MSVWRDLFGFAKRDAESTPRQMVGFASEGGLLPGGVSVRTVVGLSSVFRCIDIISNGVSQLDWREYRGNLELPPSRLVQRPQSQYTRREWTSKIAATMALYDVAYAYKVLPDTVGEPVSLVYIDPSLIVPKMTPFGSLLPPDMYTLNGKDVSVDDLVVFRRGPLPGVDEAMSGLLNLARIEFAAALAAESYASRYWQAGGSPQTVLETDAAIDTTTADDIQERWYQRRSRGPDYAPVLSRGLKAKDMGADPTSAAAVEARREMTADIGRYFGIPTALLNAPAGDTETYATTEQQGLHLITYTLTNYIAAIEDGISDVLGGSRLMRMDTTRLRTTTLLEQAQAYQLATGGQPWITVPEVRERIGLPPQEEPISLPAGQVTING